MATFSDGAGRVWTVAVTVAGVKAVREATGVKLGALLNDKMKGLGELLTDPEQLANVVWVLVRGQHPNVTDEQFGAALGGDAAEDLAEAFFAAFVNFCPRQSRRLLLAVREKNAALQTLRVDAATAELAAIDPATLSGSAGNSPASSASTPAP